jgi:hypothetical protein
MLLVEIFLDLVGGGPFSEKPADGQAKRRRSGDSEERAHLRSTLIEALQALRAVSAVFVVVGVAVGLWGVGWTEGTWIAAGAAVVCVTTIFGLCGLRTHLHR